MPEHSCMFGLSVAKQRLWGLAGSLFVGAWVAKSFVWQRVQAQVIREKEIAETKALKTLTEARSSAQKYVLPPLDEDQREKIRSKQA